MAWDDMVVVKDGMGCYCKVMNAMGLYGMM